MNARIVVMGVTGCGKSSVSQALAKALDTQFVEGDGLHTDANVEKMRAGIPLTDADRWPWLNRIGSVLRKGNVVITCSALRRIYRDRLREAAEGTVQFIHLVGSRELITTRMQAREGHYMPLSLLDSQFATLEEPAPGETAISIQINQSLSGITKTALTELRIRGIGP
ncbi:MAG: gluconokinase [Pseudorhodobacter sp.]